MVVPMGSLSSSSVIGTSVIESFPKPENDFWAEDEEEDQLSIADTVSSAE